MRVAVLGDDVTTEVASPFEFISSTAVWFPPMFDDVLKATVAKRWSKSLYEDTDERDVHAGSALTLQDML